MQAGYRQNAHRQSTDATSENVNSLNISENTSTSNKSSTNPQRQPQKPKPPNPPPPAHTHKATPTSTTKCKPKPQLTIAIQNSNNSQSSLHRNNSNSSIISELDEIDQYTLHENENMQDERHRLIVKICDGVYIGGIASIWDVDNMAVNYISHLIKITPTQTSNTNNSNNGTSSSNNSSSNINSNPAANNSQQYVPDLITYIHSLQYNFDPQHALPSCLQTFNKINQFINHAKQIGESCIIVCKQQSSYNSNNANNHRNDNAECLYQCVYPSAAIVVGYLMYKYGWALLKAMQFVNARLTAAHKTTHLLHSINQQLKSTHPHKSTNARNHNHNYAGSVLNSHGVYSQVMAHMFPQLPHTVTLDTQSVPNINKLPLKSLYFLEKQMIGNRRILSYNWKNCDKFRDNDFQYIFCDQNLKEELILTNTYLNCTLGSQQSTSYKGVLQRNSCDAHAKSSKSFKSMNSSINLIPKPQQKHNQTKNNETIIKNRRSLRILPSKTKSINSSLQIRKKPNTLSDMVPIDKSMGSMQVSQQLQLKKDATTQSLTNIPNIESDRKGLRKGNMHVSWSNLDQIFEVEQYYKCVSQSQVQIKNNSSKCKQKQQAQQCIKQLQQYTNTIKNTYKLTQTNQQGSINSNKVYNKLKLIPKQTPSASNNPASHPNSNMQQSSISANTNTNHNLNLNLNKGKIVVNVMNMIANNTYTSRTQQRQLNKKKNYQSRTRLPTIHDITNYHINQQPISNSNHLSNSPNAHHQIDGLEERNLGMVINSVHSQGNLHPTNPKNPKKQIKIQTEPDAPIIHQHPNIPLDQDQPIETKPTLPQPLPMGRKDKAVQATINKLKQIRNIQGQLNRNRNNQNRRSNYFSAN